MPRAELFSQKIAVASQNRTMPVVTGEPLEVTVAVNVIGVLYGTDVADIANVVAVGAGAANAAAVIVVTIAKTTKAFAQNLPIEDNTEEQSELENMRVIGSLLARYYGPNFSTHGNLHSRSEPITRKLHRLNRSIGHYLARIEMGRKKIEQRRPSERHD